MLVSPFPLSDLYIQTSRPLISHYHHDSDDGDTNKLMMVGEKKVVGSGVESPDGSPSAQFPILTPIF